MRAVPGPLGWLQTLTGIALLLILFTFDTDDRRTAPQSCAFAAVCGFCLMLVASGFLARWASQPGTVQVAVPGGWLSVVWVASAIVFFFIDLMRMGNRGTAQRPAAVAAAHRPGVIPAAPIPTFAATPSAQQMTPEPTPFAAPAPTPTEQPAPPVPEPVTVPNPPEAAAVQPAAAPVSGPPPKQVGIYVNLLGEGLNMMRAVAAHDLGRGYYLIVEPMPEGETWQFQTGQVVRCQKKSLANGKHLVAIEEAPRA